MYHRFSENKKPGYTSRAQFAKQLQYLSKYHRLMTLSELIQYRNSKQAIPNNTVIITVDDGYQDFYEVAYPLLHRYQIPSTLFVVTGFIDGSLWLWPDQVSWLLGTKTRRDKEVTIGPVKLLAGAQQPDDWQQLIDYLLTVDDDEKHRLIEHLATVWGLNLPKQPPVEYAPMSWQQIREMQEAGVEVGGHTISHPSLGKVSSKQARYELEGCMASLTEHLGEAPRAFCYPNGQPEDYTEEIKALVQQVGYTCAVVAFSENGESEGLYSLQRHSCSENWLAFKRTVSGFKSLSYKFHRVVRSNA
jgi:peptidoglycan/xylan/chitin deacetylase (PgdA/CDA1 family)